MIRSFLRRGRDPAIAGLPALAELRDLQARFAERRRVVVDGVLSGVAPDAIARAAAAHALVRRAPPPRELSMGEPSFMFYEGDIEPHRNCRRACAPICRISWSLAHGHHLELLQAIASDRKLAVEATKLLVFVKGSHVDRAVATRAGIEAICCASSWQAAFGGHFEFGDGQPEVPRFGMLHVHEVRPGDSSAVGLVTEHGPLVLVSAWIREA